MPDTTPPAPPGTHSPSSPSSPDLFEASPDDFLLPSGFDPSHTAGFLELTASLDAKGQLVEVLACEAEGRPGKLDPIDGLHRVSWAKMRGKKVRVRRVKRPGSELEKEILIYTVNAKRRRMTLTERRERLLNVMNAAPHWTQKQAGAALDMSETMVSTLLSTECIPESDLKRLQEAGVCDAVVCMIGPLRPPERMRQAVEFACSGGTDGKPPTRDQFSLWLKRSKGRGKKPLRQPKPTALALDDSMELILHGGKPAPLVVTTDGGIVVLFPASTDYCQAEADLKAALARVRKGKRLDDAEIQPVILPQQ